MSLQPNTPVALSTSKLADMYRSDRTRVQLACSGLGDLTAHHMAPGATGQRRYTLVLPAYVDPITPDPLSEAKLALLSRLPHVVIETISLWRDEEADNALKVTITFAPAPSTDTLSRVDVDHMGEGRSFTPGLNGDPLEAAADWLAELATEPGDEPYARITCHFAGIAHGVESIALLAPPGQRPDLRGALLGRNVY